MEAKYKDEEIEVLTAKSISVPKNPQTRGSPPARLLLVGLQAVLRTKVEDLAPLDQSV